MASEGSTDHLTSNAEMIDGAFPQPANDSEAPTFTHVGEFVVFTVDSLVTEEPATSLDWQMALRQAPVLDSVGPEAAIQYFHHPVPRGSFQCAYAPLLEDGPLSAVWRVTRQSEIPKLHAFGVLRQMSKPNEPEGSCHIWLAATVFDNLEFCEADKQVFSVVGSLEDLKVTLQEAFTEFATMLVPPFPYGDVTRFLRDTDTLDDFATEAARLLEDKSLWPVTQVHEASNNLVNGTGDHSPET